LAATLLLPAMVVAEIVIPSHAGRQQATADIKSAFDLSIHEILGDNREVFQMEHLRNKATSGHEPTPPQTRVQSPARSATSRPHVDFVRKTFERFNALQSGSAVLLDGKSLQIPDVVAVAKYEERTQPMKPD
jgi:hypothetical protein